jgi:hypothetical protein
VGPEEIEGSLTSRSADLGQGVVPISEIDVLWITAGLGCDGDTIAVCERSPAPSLATLGNNPLPGLPESCPQPHYCCVTGIMLSSAMRSTSLL